MDPRVLLEVFVISTYQTRLGLRRYLGRPTPIVKRTVEWFMSSTTRYVRWQEGDMWLGYLEEFPDYLTQGESLSELEENLRDLYRDLRSGEIPGVLSVAELTLE